MKFCFQSRKYTFEKYKGQFRQIHFLGAHAIEEAFRKDRWCSAEKGTESTKKGEGEQQHKEKLSTLPFKLMINAAQWEKRTYRTAYFRITDKSERGRRSLVVASQAVGVVAVYRPHRRPNPFVSGQSFHFQMIVALGDTLLVPLSLTVRVLRRELISTSATRRANREEKNMVKENNASLPINSIKFE